jgi:hypothetical protein
MDFGWHRIKTDGATKKKFDLPQHLRSQEIDEREACPIVLIPIYRAGNGNQ